jgi:hypothetical protein
MGQSEGKRSLVRPRRRWKDNIKLIFKKWDGGMDWIDLAKNRAKILPFCLLQIPQSHKDRLEINLWPSGYMSKSDRLIDRRTCNAGKGIFYAISDVYR